VKGGSDERRDKGELWVDPYMRQAAALRSLDV